MQDQFNLGSIGGGFGGEGRALWGGKYRENWRNLSHFSKEYFLENDKLMLVINIF